MSVFFSFLLFKTNDASFCSGFTLIFPFCCRDRWPVHQVSMPSSVCSCLSASLIWERNGTNQSSCRPSIIVHNRAAPSHAIPSPPFSCPLPSFLHTGSKMIILKHSHSCAGIILCGCQNPLVQHLEQPGEDSVWSLGSFSRKAWALILCFSATRLWETLLFCSEPFLLVYLPTTLHRLESDKCLKEKINQVFEAPPIPSL